MTDREKWLDIAECEQCENYDKERNYCGITDEKFDEMTRCPHKDCEAIYELNDSEYLKSLDEENQDE